MIKSICDGCKKEVEEYSRVKILVAHHNNETGGVGRYETFRKMELCEECKNKFLAAIGQF